MIVGYFYKEGVTHAWSGAPLKQYDLKTVLNWLPQLPKDHEKNSMGSIYFHTNNVVGVENNPVSDGIIGCDIDRISREDCDKIINKFDELSMVFPCLVACWYSHSYYNKEKPYGGLHLVLKADVDELIYDVIGDDNPNSYRRYNTLYSAALTRVIFKVCGVDVRPFYRPEYGKSGGIDSAMKTIGQKCYLNYSEIVRWNENVFNVSFSDEYITELKKWFIGYNWFDTESEFKTISADVKRFDGKKILNREFKPNEDAFGDDKQMGHKRRIAVENFLAGLGWELNDIVEFIINICYGDDFKNGESVLRKAIRQTTKTAIAKFRDRPSVFYTEKAKEILTAIGVDIEVDIKKVYRPFEYNFDPIFVEVLEEHKDDVIYGGRSIPVLTINLKSDEYLNDYKFQINSMITRYEMTYLVADCMVGKTHYAMNMKSVYGLFDDDFIVHFKGDSIDVCVPYNSVADNKVNPGRKDLKRVKTADLTNFGVDKRNMFIWNTVKPLYEKYFNSGMVKRLVLFFDESQKIVTDDYRWETVFEMFKVLPNMYKHFVFMTGTPAGELDYLLQYFDDYCVIKVDKEIDYKRECKILKYEKFGMGDKIKLIEEVIDGGRLPLIYTNSKNYEWKEACLKINNRRVECGLKPLRILDYSRPNTDRLGDVNKSNSIKDYDVVIATKYCSVGIDFQKDDRRMRCAIIDYAGEKECTFHDIWQFTLRNRNQDTITKIIVNDNEQYYNKLYCYKYYVKLFDDIAKMHTYKTTGNEMVDTESDMWAFAMDVFLERKFGKLLGGKNRKENYFNNDKNVKLLSVYYTYLKVFSNMNIIKHMLEKRGVEITEIDMEHTTESIDYTKKKEVYRFFVDNYDEIKLINERRALYDNMSHQIDINSDEVENITDGKIHSRNKHYMDWLITSFTSDNEWVDILKEREYITKGTFDRYRRMSQIARNVTKKEIDKIKRFRKVMTEDDLDDMVVDMVSKRYGLIGFMDNDEIRKAIVMHEVIEDTKRIVRFAIDNIEFIEEIKNIKDENGRMTATQKMMVVMEQKENEMIRKRKSDGGKKHSKTVTVRYKSNGKEQTFGSVNEFCSFFGVSNTVFYALTKHKKCKLSDIVELTAYQ